MLAQKRKNIPLRWLIRKLHSWQENAQLPLCSRLSTQGFTCRRLRVSDFHLAVLWCKSLELYFDKMLIELITSSQVFEMLWDLKMTCRWYPKWSTPVCSRDKPLRGLFLWRRWKWLSFVIISITCSNWSFRPHFLLSLLIVLIFRFVLPANQPLFCILGYFFLSPLNVSLFVSKDMLSEFKFPIKNFPRRETVCRGRQTVLIYHLGCFFSFRVAIELNCTRNAHVTATHPSKLSAVLFCSSISIYV